MRGRLSSGPGRATPPWHLRSAPGGTRTPGRTRRADDGPVETTRVEAPIHKRPCSGVPSRTSSGCRRVAAWRFRSEHSSIYIYYMYYIYIHIYRNTPQHTESELPTVRPRVLADAAAAPSSDRKHLRRRGLIGEGQHFCDRNDEVRANHGGFASRQEVTRTSSTKLRCK